MDLLLHLLPDGVQPNGRTAITEGGHALPWLRRQRGRSLDRGSKVANVSTPSAIGGPGARRASWESISKSGGPLLRTARRALPPIASAYPAFTAIDNETPQSNSHYNSMILAVTRSVASLTLQSSFTWAKCIDYISNGIDGVDVGNDAALSGFNPISPAGTTRALEAFNVGKNWTTNALLPLPFHGNMFKDGWQIGLIASARTGSPIPPTETVDQGNWPAASPARIFPSAATVPISTQPSQGTSIPRPLLWLTAQRRRCSGSTPARL